ncbi:hypothetical protein EW145_g4467 [Phellinidium pouzarii]|uniref:WW domain-containing protein n=1 Tax=Phellinidium pouzarii TaxID=167371 RepID=A0A4S4L4T7_9AGAM|nr:hypothetical protein EW145_g4467 [Phellinidium pouzarii]
MVPRIFVTLLKRLLVLCQHWGHQSLRCLLHLYSTLIRPSATRPHLPVVDGETGNSIELSQSRLAESLPDSACNSLIERPTVLVCASVPSTPPRARTYKHHASVDSYSSTILSPSSTLFGSPDGTLDVEEDKRKFAFPMGLEALTSGSPQSSEDCLAKPAGVIVPPRKSMKCLFPSLSSRYERKIKIESNQGPWKFKPLETFTAFEDAMIPDWTFHIQPEGQPYFYNKSPTLKFRYLTEAPLSNDGILAEVNLFVNEFERKASGVSGLPTNVEVVLEVDTDFWLYYLIDIDRRCVFWLDECLFDDVIPPNFGVERLEQLRHLLAFEFWQHTEFFPSHRPLPDGVLEELLGILVHSHIDVVTSLSSTAAYDAREIQALIGSVKHLQGLHPTGPSSSYLVTSAGNPPDGPSREREIFQFLWFPRSAPFIASERLKKLWIDNAIKTRHWKTFQLKLERDWEGFVLYSTVLLNGNVAFLAIPSVMSDNNGPLWYSPAAVASQISIVASLGSIIIGLLLVRQLRISASDCANDAIAYLERRTHPQLGLETMAILYSLPYALLMWGMLTFLGSVAIVCFYDVNDTATILTRMLYGVAWLFVLLLICWTVLTGWETTSHVNWRSLLPNFVFHPQAAWKDWRNGGKDEEGSDQEGANSDTETEDKNLDTRSVMSVRSSRLRTTVSMANRRKWRSRLRRLAETPKRRFTWNSTKSYELDEITPTKSRSSYFNEPSTSSH